MLTHDNASKSVICAVQSREDIFHLGVKAFIKNSKNQILVLKNEGSTQSYWDLPGGRVHVGEQCEETLRREVLEETGITIERISPLGMMTSSIRIPLATGTTVGLIFSFYQCTIDTTDTTTVTLSDEHHHYTWMSLDEARHVFGTIYGNEFINSIASII